MFVVYVLEGIHTYLLWVESSCSNPLLSVKCMLCFSGIGPSGGVMSDNIWNSLRYSVRQSGNMAAVDLVDRRDLPGLLTQFGGAGN